MDLMNIFNVNGCAVLTFSLICDGCWWLSSKLSPGIPWSGKTFFDDIRFTFTNTASSKHFSGFAISPVISWLGKTFLLMASSFLSPETASVKTSFWRMLMPFNKTKFIHILVWQNRFWWHRGFFHQCTIIKSCVWCHYEFSSAQSRRQNQHTVMQNHVLNLRALPGFVDHTAVFWSGVQKSKKIGCGMDT